MASLRSLPPEILLRIINEVVNEDLFTLLEKMSQLMTLSQPMKKSGEGSYLFRLSGPPLRYPASMLVSVKLSHTNSFFLSEVPKSYFRRANAPEIVTLANLSLGGVDILMNWAWKGGSRQQSYLDHVESKGVQLWRIRLYLNLRTVANKDVGLYLMMQPRHKAVEEQSEGTSEA